ncbi:MAG: DUF87 domain-containing protein [Candidatus Methanomethyliaceae archaeon]|nr:DUF87 domain-containing protein [Candidatus Methanomethyliaceae archaeon]MDW7971522.1 DUF87 domain-containing protein [Nitrososphaerota archaeon]
MELIVGKIEGVTTTDFFTMVITNPCIGKEDYVEVEHEGRKYLLIVKEIRRFGDKLLADCIIIGTSPKIPFNTGLEVKLASEETIRRGLGLTAKEADGIYIGKLRDLMIWLPVRKLTRIFIVGKPGAGKSYTMGVIAEELMKKGVPLVIVDAHGEYSSLKVPAESPSEEFKVEPRSYADYIIEFANLTFNPGADIDISALESMRIEDLVSQMQCTIINLRGLPLIEQYYIVSKLLNRLLEAIMIMQIPPFYLVLDEAHIFAGRGKQKDPLIKECSEVVRRFAQEGRKFGANLIVLTQRPQLLDMTVRSLSATWIIHQLTDPNDVKIAIESGGLSKEWSDKINWLEPGEAIITGDVVERIPLHIKIRRRETRHGAPGFNPLDFVSPEERERMKKRLSSMKTRLIKIQAIQEGPPSLALPSLYLPIAIDEEKILSKLKDNRTLDHVELIKHNLKYMPSLFAEAMVSTFKRIPSIEIKDRIRRIIPVDSSITTFDWRYESAYGLTIEDVTNPLSTPQREGKHIQPSSLIMEYSGVENLKGLFKNFAISKLTQQIYYHKELNEYSKLGESVEEFKNRIKERLESIKRNKITEISSFYESKIKELDLSISSIREEYESLKKLINEIEEELKSLKKEKAKMEREGKSLLKISEQIRTREMRINRLEKKLTELSDKISSYRKERGILEDKMREEIKRATSEIDAMMNSPIQTMMFQPKHDEVNIEAMHVVWVPIFEAIYRIYFNGSKKELRFEWNGVNGRGNFGSCSECGTSIDQLMEPLICYKCGEIYCQDHLILCSNCWRGVCNEHQRVCPSCGKIYCIEEKKYLCYECGKELCDNCVLTCGECRESLCKDHARICKVCGNIFCNKHYHVKNCSNCNKPLCTLEQISCKLCEKVFCKECVVKCSNCNNYACNPHTWYCSACNRSLCAIEDRYECLICKKSLCEMCIETCQLCGVNLCRIHINNCPECNRKICPNCMVERRKLGIFRRNLCKICALK